MSKIEELHEGKEDAKAHAELTLEVTRKFTLWVAYVSQQVNTDISFDNLDELINHFLEKVYKPE